MDGELRRVMARFASGAALVLLRGGLPVRPAPARMGREDDTRWVAAQCVELERHEEPSKASAACDEKVVRPPNALVHLRRSTFQAPRCCKVRDASKRET